MSQRAETAVHHALNTAALSQAAAVVMAGYANVLREMRMLNNRISAEWG
jgi:hypothetical protein